MPSIYLSATEKKIQFAWLSFLKLSGENGNAK